MLEGIDQDPAGAVVEQHEAVPEARPQQAMKPGRRAIDEPHEGTAGAGTRTPRAPGYVR
jgi:hypothetical protein